MVFSGTNVTLGFVPETTHGTTPTTPSFSVFRATGRNINLKRDTLESAEVKSSRLRGDVRHGFNRVEGDIAVELAMQAYNPFLLWSLGGASSGSVPTWDNPPTFTGVNLSISAVDASIATAKTADFTRIGGNWTDDGYRPGDWVRTALFTTGVNNGDWRIITILSATVVRVATATTTLVVETGVAGTTFSYIGKKAVIYGVGGSKLRTFTLERGFNDGVATPVVEVFRGCAVNTLNVSMRPESLVAATFGIVGMTADIDQTTSLDANAAYFEAPTNAPLAGVDATGYIGQFAQTLTAFDFNVDNQRTLFGQLGTKTSPDVFEGTSKVTGNISFVLIAGSVARLTAFQDENTFSFSIRVNEVGTSDFMSFAFHKMKLTGADMDPPALGPVLIQTPFEALEQSFTGGSTTYKEVMQIQRSTTSNNTDPATGFPDA